jgi:DNA-binding CsgD family transcriptional regulator
MERALEQRLIGDLYQAAVSPERWDGNLRSLIALFDASGGLVISSPTPAQGGVALCHGIGGATAESYQRQFSREALEPGRPASRSLTAFIRRGRGRCRPPALCALIRGDHQEPFGARDRARLQALMPHVARALGMTFRMRHADAMWTAAQETLNRVSSAVLLVGGHGDLLFASRAARRVLAGQPGAQERVAKAIRSTLSGGAHIDAEGLLVPGAAGAAPLALQFMRVGREGAPATQASAARIVVFIAERGNACSLDRGALRELYGLTPSEAGLAEHLCSGVTLQAAARKQGISAHTARSHLKNVFHKTGVSRQQELVRLLVSLTPHHQHAPRRPHA